jgi:hypothetical protein
MLCADYISSDGYGIMYERKHNRIVINLPPTTQTVTNTVEQIAERKVDLTDEDLILLLEMSKYICKL